MLSKEYIIFCFDTLKSRWMSSVMLRFTVLWIVPAVRKLLCSEHDVLYWTSVKEVFCLQLTHLILLGSMRSMSLSFFQKSCGGGEASTLHSNLTVSPSSAREFIIFWTKVGGRRTSWAAGESEVTQHRQLEGGCYECAHSRRGLYKYNLYKVNKWSMITEKQHDLKTIIINYYFFIILLLFFIL